MSTITCSLNCANGGYCSLYPFKGEAMTTSPVDGSLREICVCPMGFAGLTCSEPTEALERCHHHGDTHVCRNGGLCRPTLDNDAEKEHGEEAEWRCDCAIADKVNNFAGAMCRRPATEYCSGDGSSFCTNGGSCVSNLVQPEFKHEGDCVCPPEFTGPHCEFLKALTEGQNNPHVVITIPTNPDWVIEGDGINEGESDSSFFALIFGSLALILLAFFFVAFRRNKRRSYRGNAPIGTPSSGDSFPLPLGTGYYGNHEEDGFDDDDYVFQDVLLT